MFFSSALTETNRVSFDVTEGESELVSGYNVEYFSVSFSLLFLAEYGHIIPMSYLMSLLCFGGPVSFTGILGMACLALKSTAVVFAFVWYELLSLE